MDFQGRKEGICINIDLCRKKACRDQWVDIFPIHIYIILIATVPGLTWQRTLALGINCSHWVLKLTSI